MKISKRAYDNCTAKDPNTCRFHGRKFIPITKFKSIEDMFEISDENIPPIKTIPFLEPNMDNYLQLVDDIEARLPLEVIWVIHSYTDEQGSRDITNYLRYPEKWGANAEKIIQDIEVMDKYIKDFSVSVPSRVLYRGINSLDSNLKNLTVGSKISFPTFLSTSESSEIAQSFVNKDHPVMLEIISPGGAPLKSSYLEYEYLLPRNSKFKVVSIEENVAYEHPRRSNTTGTTRIVLEHLD